MGPLNLKLILQAVDRASGPTSRVSGAIGGLMGRVGVLTLRMAKMTAIGSALAGGGAIAASMVVARSAWSMVKEAADAGDAANKSAQKVGLTVRAWQRLAWAAQLADVGQEELSMGLGLLSSNMVAAAKGGKEDVAMFRALGVSVRDTRGDLKAGDVVLGEIADRFAKLPDGPEKTAAAMKLFGRSGKEMIPLLNAGGAAMRSAGDEAERLGIVLSDDQARAAEEFNDNMSRMKTSVFGLKVGIGTALIPTLNRGIVGVTAWIAAHRPELIAKVNVVVAQLSAGLAKVDWVQFAEGVGKAIVGVVKLFEMIGGLHGIITGVGVAAILQFTASIFSIGTTFATMIGVASGPIGWIILAVGALATGAFLLWRNWDKVAKWFGGVWTRIKTAFADGATAVWNSLPPWLRMIFKGVAFAVKFAAGAAGAVTGAATASGARPQPAVAAGVGGAGGRVQVGIKVDQDGRVRQVTSRTDSGVMARMVRGQAQAAF